MSAAWAKWILWALTACHGGTVPVTAADWSAAVLEKAMACRDGGGYQRDWKGSGTLKEIQHQGVKILPQGTGGTYCSGFTFTIVMDVLQDNKLIPDKSAAEIRQFQKTWYGADPRDPAGREQQCLKALTDLGLGQAVALENAQPGHFIQFWRSKSGHSAILVSLIRAEGKITGFTYRSSQGSNGPARESGIGTKTEYYQGHGGDVDPARVYVVRLADD